LLCNRKELAIQDKENENKNTVHELCLTDGSNEQGVIVHYDKSQKVNVFQMPQNFGSQAQIIGKLDCEPRLEAGIINCKLFILAQAPAGVKHAHLEPGLRIRIQLGQWIRIQEGKNDPKKWEKIKKFHVLKCWMFSFES
jgi:hypothetical protein